MVKLAEMILTVRSEISDIPEEHLSDLQVYNNLKDAKSYVDALADDTATDAQLEDCYM
jgi:hypothetical protein